MFTELTTRDVADMFARQRGMGTDRTGQALVDRVTSFLAEKGLGHRNPIDVAEEALAVEHERAKPPPAPSPEELAWQQHDIQQGTTASTPQLMGELEFADRVKAMSLDEYAKMRSHLGIGMGRDTNLNGFIFAGENRR